MDLSFRTLLTRYFDIINLPLDYRVLALKAWELSVQNQLKIKSPVIFIVPK